MVQGEYNMYTFTLIKVNKPDAKLYICAKNKKSLNSFNKKFI